MTDSAGRPDDPTLLLPVARPARPRHGSSRPTRAPGQAGGAQPQQAGAAVPDRPSLAPGVLLRSQMEESAFVEPQWLAQRDGRFVQLTELLFRLLEQIDGERTLDEIAERLGDAIDRQVTVDNVRQLIATKLIPAGLVVDAAGRAAPASGRGGRSLLQVNLKTHVLGPELIDPVTAVLQWLFWPPVLAATLAASALALGWLYFVHGAAASVHDALYSPHLLIVVLAVIIAATAFHEFGHAAALRYGGGQVRGMGVGVYLIYPAFYTDVTDNYRLGRWARVRTDLGGIYFNLIFAAGIVALYLATRAEFLLVAAILLNLQTVQQLLPFVRLDGYWILADLTGIPDFYTHMGGFLRSVLPIGSGSGAKLPALKWWAKGVFGGYVLVVLPTLAFMTYLAIAGFPRLAATAWDSGGRQLAGLGRQYAAGDAPGLVATVLGIVLLALPVLGLLYGLFNGGRALVRLLWSWSEDSARKRTLAILATGTTIAALALLWLPQMPFLAPGTPGPLYAVASSRFTPLAPTERGTVGDALGSEVVTVPLHEWRPPVAQARATEIALTPTDETTPKPGTTATVTASEASVTSTPPPSGTPADALATAVPPSSSPTADVAATVAAPTASASTPFPSPSPVVTTAPALAPVAPSTAAPVQPRATPTAAAPAAASPAATASGGTSPTTPIAATTTARSPTPAPSATVPAQRSGVATPTVPVATP